MTTCPNDALKDNQSNPYPRGRKPKPKFPSSVSKLTSLFWKRGITFKLYSTEMQLRFTFCHHKDLSTQELNLFVVFCLLRITEGMTYKKGAKHHLLAQAMDLHPLTLWWQRRNRRPNLISIALRFEKNRWSTSRRH